MIDPDVTAAAHIAGCVPLVGAGYNNARCYGQYVYGLLRFIVQTVLVFVADEDIVCGMGAVLVAIDIVEASYQSTRCRWCRLRRGSCSPAKGRSIACSPEPGYARHNRCLPVLQIGNYLLRFLLFDVAF
jgi:hypothetical protein